MVTNNFAKNRILEHFRHKSLFSKPFFKTFFGFLKLDILKMSFFQNPPDFLKEKNQKYILFFLRI